LNKRKVVLENFVDYIMKSPLLKRSIYVSEFLSIADEGLFKERKKDAENK
jgi:hypothetical protein